MSYARQKEYLELAKKVPSRLARLSVLRDWGLSSIWAKMFRGEGRQPSADSGPFSYKARFKEHRWSVKAIHPFCCCPWEIARAQSARHEDISNTGKIKSSADLSGNGSRCPPEFNIVVLVPVLVPVPCPPVPCLHFSFMPPLPFRKPSGLR